MILIFLSMLDGEAERELFRRFYEVCHKGMEETAMRVLNNQTMAEDAMQSAFCHVITHFERVTQIPERFWPGWCGAIVRNEAFSLLRKERRLVPLEDAEEPSTQMEDRSGYDAVVAAFAGLPEGERAALEQYFLMERSYAEIGESLGLTEAAVRMRVSRGRTKLQALIRKEGLYP